MPHAVRLRLLVPWKQALFKWINSHACEHAAFPYFFQHVNFINWCARHHPVALVKLWYDKNKRLYSFTVQSIINSVNWIRRPLFPYTANASPLSLSKWSKDVTMPDDYGFLLPHKPAYQGSRWVSSPAATWKQYAPKHVATINVLNWFTRYRSHINGSAPGRWGYFLRNKILHWVRG